MFYYEILPGTKIKNCTVDPENKFRKFRLFNEEVQQLPREHDFNDGIYIFRDTTESVNRTRFFIDGREFDATSGQVEGIKLGSETLLPGYDKLVDLTGKVPSKEEVDQKQDKLTAGPGIYISSDNKISVDGLNDGDTIVTDNDLEAALAGKQDNLGIKRVDGVSIIIGDDGTLFANARVNAQFDVSNNQRKPEENTKYLGVDIVPPETPGDDTVYKFFYQGPTYYDGKTPPSDSLGEVGDIYFQFL